MPRVIKTIALSVALLLIFYGWVFGWPEQDTTQPQSFTENNNLSSRFAAPPQGDGPAKLSEHVDAKKYGYRADVPRARPPQPTPPPKTQRRQLAAVSGAPCSVAEFAQAQNLAEAIAMSTSVCIYELWGFDSDVETVVAEANVMTIANALEADAVDLVSNVNRVTNLMFFLQIAFYHEFYQSAITYDTAAFSAAQNAMLAVRANANFMDETTAARDLRHQWATSIDSTNGTVLALDTIEALLLRYHTNAALASIYKERSIVYSCFFSIQRQIGTHKSGGASSPWYNAIPPSLLSVISDIALDLNYNSDTEYLITNALWLAGHFSFLNTAASDAGRSILSTAYSVFNINSATWLWAVRTIEGFYGALLTDGTPLDVNQIRADIYATAFPNRFEFDQGRLIFNTGVDLATAKELYDALKEVKSQFFRVTTFLNPVPDDNNEVLNLTIYAGRSDYEIYHPFLFGLGTDSGGIFIEEDGTLYTYQRTPQESIYTLEELLRHEYVHYLDSRFVIAGRFGEAGTLYDKNRLVWYNEGLAEFLVGSTRVNRVLPRGVLISRVKDDAARMSVADITSSTYGDFTFYRYAGLLFGYLYENRPDLFMQLFDAARSNDKAVFDQLVASISNQNAAYQAYLDQMIMDYNESARTFAEDVSTTLTPPGLLASDLGMVRATLVAEAPANTGHFRLWPDRFLYFDHLSISSQGVSEEIIRTQLGRQMDNLLLTLTPMRDEFTSAVAWFGNVQIIGGNAVIRYAVEGPFKLGSDDGQAPSAPGGLEALQAGGGNFLRWIESAESDIAGYNVYTGSTTGGPYQKVNASTFPLAEYRDNSEPGGNIHYVVTAVDAWGNESGYSNEASVTVPVLIVNGYFDSFNDSYVTDYAKGLDTIGVSHSIWDPFIDGPVTSQVLAPYTNGIVIWAVGYHHSAYPEQLDAPKQELLASYLDAGGSLIFSGAYTASHLDATTLFTDYFFINHVKNVDSTRINGVEGHFIGDGLVLNISAYQSEIDVNPGATTALVYDPLSGTNDPRSSGTAVATVDSAYKTAFLGFPFDSLDNAAQTDLLTRTIEWMLPGACTGSDSDTDGRPDACDVCPEFDDLADIDRDAVPDGCDAFPVDANARSDTDSDGMPDEWEMEHFNTLDRDGTGDFDNDGISDLDEYLNATDPTTSVIEKGDVNKDQTVDLADAILCLQAAAGIEISTPISKDADVDGDGRLGLSDAIYIMQIISGIR